jgi:molybdopterin/thiamine biosynthesis adenylyltransferase
MMPWFQAHPVRFAEEKDGLEAMGFVLDVNPLSGQPLVSFSGFLPEYPDRQLKISFPWSYPSIAPTVTDDGQCPLLPRHHKADGRTYCLFGPESKQWYAGLTGVDAICATKELIEDVLAGNKLPARDPFPEPFSAQAVFADSGVILVPPGISDYLPDDQTKIHEGMFRLKYDPRPSRHAPFTSNPPRGIVVAAKFGRMDGQVQCAPGYANLAGRQEFAGRITFIPDLDHPIHDGADLAALLQQRGIPTQNNYGWHALVFPEESGDRTTRRYSWLVFKKESNVTYSPLRTITYRSSEKSARIPGLEFLSQKKIAIVGCGSLGSKVAASLASSGVCRFLLIDKELFEPANSVRHECGVEFFGISKVRALAARLRSLNPDLTTDSISAFCDPFGQLDFEIRRQVYEDLSNCDLIVHATGHGGIARAVNELSKTYSIPSLHLSVTNGAWSGEVIRFIPNRSSCWLCFQSAFGDENPPGKEAPLGHIFGPGCDQPTFTGSTHDLGIVAGLATGYAIDTLRVADGGTSEYAGDYLLWEGRNSEGKLLQRTTVKAIPSREECVVC